MQVRVDGSRVLVAAPAKVNLFFEILARRDDGYHEIETVMTKISLCDSLSFEPHPSELKLTVDSRTGDCIPHDDRNLALKAVAAIAARSGQSRGATLRLIKRIPSAAGLGGGSSDAAAALVAANIGWGLGLQTAELIELAAEIGSDVPFFLGDSPAICRGRGEQITSIQSRRRGALVVTRPPASLSTADVYRNCEVPRNPTQWDVEGSAKPGSWFNRLQATAETLTPWIEKTADAFRRMRVPWHQMSGSGPCYFGLCRHLKDARRLAGRLRHQAIGQVFCVSCCF